MSRRDQITMTPQEMRAFLHQAHILQTATIGPDGAPHLVPMFFFMDGDVPAYWTYAKSQKVRNLERDDRVTVMAEDGKDYAELRGVTIAGRAEIIRDPDEIQRFGEQIYEKYWGPIADDTVREGVRVMGAKRIVIRVHADAVTSWDHRKLDGGY
jgi:PPOX class probable F420-dependent enzyme